MGSLKASGRLGVTGRLWFTGFHPPTSTYPSNCVKITGQWWGVCPDPGSYTPMFIALLDGKRHTPLSPADFRTGNLPLGSLTFFLSW